MKAKKLLSLGFVFSFLCMAQFAVADVTVTRLDSITYTNNDGDVVKQEKMQYTEDGLITSHVTFNTEYGNDTTTVTYTYNELGQLTEKLTATDNSNVHSKSKEEYAYDENGILNQTTLSADWGFGQGWNNSTKKTTKLNAKGLLEEYVMYIWDSYSSEVPYWAINVKNVYTYDEQDRVVKVDNYDYTELLSSAEEYTYTEEGGQTTRIGIGVTYLDPETTEVGETPYDEWKDTQISDADGVISYEKEIYGMVSYDWETGESEYGWMGDIKYTVTKVNGPFGSSVITDTYNWNTTTKEWYINKSTEESLSSGMSGTMRTITESFRNPNYDEENPESTEMINTKRTIYSLSGDVVTQKQVYDITGLYASVTEEEIYTVDMAVTLDQIYAPATLAAAPYFFNRKPISVVKNTFSGSPHTTDRVTYHYTSPETAVYTEKVANVNVFFTEGVLTVDTPNAEIISVYSVSGKLLFSANKTESKANFNMSLTQGVYVVKGNGWAVKILK